jgi:hypothetical protein
MRATTAHLPRTGQIASASSAISRKRVPSWRARPRGRCATGSRRRGARRADRRLELDLARPSARRGRKCSTRRGRPPGRPRRGRAPTETIPPRSPRGRPLHATLDLEVDPRRRAAHRPCSAARYSLPPSSSRVRPSNTTRSPSFEPLRAVWRRRPRSVRPFRSSASADRAPVGLVVEADVAADHRRVERLAGLGGCPRSPARTATDLGLLGVAEVEAVGDGDRQRAGADRLRAASATADLGADGRGRGSSSGRCSRREGDAALGALDPQHGGVRARICTVLACRRCSRTAPRPSASRRCWARRAAPSAPRPGRSPGAGSSRRRRRAARRE